MALIYLSLMSKLHSLIIIIALLSTSLSAQFGSAKIEFDDRLLRSDEKYDLINLKEDIRQFFINTASDKDLEGANIVIWTTTPWTIPGNRALAFGSNLKYSLIEVENIAEDSLVKVGDKLIFAEDLVGIVSEEIGRQATMIGYVNAYYLYALAALVVMPLAFFARKPQLN